MQEDLDSSFLDSTLSTNLSKQLNILNQKTNSTVPIAQNSPIIIAPSPWLLGKSDIILPSWQTIAAHSKAKDNK